MPVSKTGALPLGHTTVYHTCRACSLNQARNLWVYDSDHDNTNGTFLPTYGTPIVLVPFNAWPPTCVYTRSKPLQLPRGRVRRSHGISQPNSFTYTAKLSAWATVLSGKTLNLPAITCDYRICVLASSLIFLGESYHFPIHRTVQTKSVSVSGATCGSSYFKADKLINNIMCRLIYIAHYKPDVRSGFGLMMGSVGLEPTTTRL